jgi:hypothetical protein
MEHGVHIVKKMTFVPKVHGAKFMNAVCKTSASIAPCPMRHAPCAVSSEVEMQKKQILLKLASKY